MAAKPEDHNGAMGMHAIDRSINSASPCTRCLIWPYRGTLCSSRAPKEPLKPIGKWGSAIRSHVLRVLSLASPRQFGAEGAP